MQMSKEKVIKYYCVLVGADNILNGEHFVPIPDDVMINIKWEFDEDERSNFTYGLPTLYVFITSKTHSLMMYLMEIYPFGLNTLNRLT